MNPLFVTLIVAVITYLLGLSHAKKISLREARLKAYSELIHFISNFPLSKHEDGFIDELIKHISPARLLASDKTENIMRSYFDEVNLICNVVKDNTMPNLKIAKQLTLDLEETMRIDLGVRFFPRKFNLDLK